MATADTLSEFSQLVTATLDRLAPATAKLLASDADGDLARVLDSLRARSARPEVRVLVLGPLKAGKSTLMNVLLQRPDISQVDPLPAYPCFVEVHGVGRSDDGAKGRERTTFVFANGRREEYPRPEAVARLRDMFDKFVEQGADARIECEQVIQEVDDETIVGNRHCVVIDSPGLFFRKNVDDALRAMNAADSAGESTYSAQTLRLYRDADVAIFVVRPEQLFFEQVAEWLRDFVKAAKMRVFVLVNATRSFLEKEDSRDTLRNYFLRQIKHERELVARFVTGDTISLHIADLLDVSRTLEGDATARETLSGAEVEQIRGYLSGNDLGEKKQRNLNDEMLKVLGRLHEVASARLVVLERDLGEAHTRRGHRAEDVRAAESRVAEAEGQVRLMAAALAEVRQREAQVVAWIDTGTAPKGDAHIAQVAGFLGRAGRADVPEPLRKELQAITRDVYARWAEHGLGERKLINLAGRVWTEVVRDKSLRSAYESLVADRVQALAGELAGAVPDAAFAEAVQSLVDKRVTVDSSNPLLRGRLPLFSYHYWGFFDGTTNLWGELGESIVARDGPLKKNASAFAGYLWDPPWDLQRYFTGEEIDAAARRSLVAALLPKWRASLQAAVAAAAMRVAAAETEMVAARARLEQAQEALAAAEARIAAIEADRTETTAARAEIAAAAASVREFSRTST